MISMRYLIVSLASVFLALGIGIFIGFMFDGQEIFLNQQETLISDLEYKFGEIRIENENLQEAIELKDKKIKHYDDFTTSIFPNLIETRLEDMNIGIIETNDDYIYNEITSTIEDAGGQVTSITYIKKEFFLEDVDKFEEVYQYFSIDKGIVVEQEDFDIFLSDQVAKAILEKDQETLQYLKEKEMIELKGDYSVDIDCFVIAGGSASNEEEIVEIVDIPIIKKIKQYNIPVVGVEQGNVKYSYIEAYKREKISTIDNVDTMIGQYSIIEVIQGEDGNFGIKPSADRLIP